MSRRAARLAAAFVSMLGLTACAPEPPRPPVATEKAADRGCVDGVQDPGDLYPEKLEVRHARGFSIEYRGHYKILSLADGRRYILVRCGAAAPESEVQEADIVTVPLRSVATTSTTELPHLEALDLVDSWVGHADKRFISSVSLRAKSEVVEIGGADGLGLDIETLLELAPDLLLIDNPDRAGIDRLGLLSKVGTHVVPVPSYRESTPLARAEWLKLTALFFDREKEARQLFGQIESRYEELRQRVEHKVAGGARRPTVLTGGPWQGVWHVPAGESFMARLLADAGADFLWADTPGVGPLMLDIEKVFERGGQADFWLYPSHWRSLPEVAAADERLAEFAAFDQGRLYAPDLRMGQDGGNDYWEQGVHRPDQVLADLVAIFHPDLMPDHRPAFHRRLESTAPGGGS